MFLGALLHLKRADGLLVLQIGHTMVRAMQIASLCQSSLAKPCSGLGLPFVVLLNTATTKCVGFRGEGRVLCSCCED